MIYTPDRWVIVETKFHDATESFRKILASWYGGYMGADSWKLSSGIVNVKEFDDRYEFLNESGSTYICFKNCVGMSSYTSRILSGWQEQLKDVGQINVVEYEQV
jgi:hypothetical protein